MTSKEMFRNLYNKYGEDFNWYMIPSTQADGAFVTELKKEIGKGHFLYDKKIDAVDEQIKAFADKMTEAERKLKYLNIKLKYWGGNCEI